MRALAVCLMFCIFFPSVSFADGADSGDGWRIVVIDGESYVQFSESVAVSILAGLEQNEIRRAELTKAFENQRNLQYALYSSQKETKKWKIVTVVVSGVAVGLLTVALIK